jgi:hypothetical protein
MKLVLSSFLLLWLCYVPPVAAQALTLDQLFWLRERSEGDNAEWLLIEHNWQVGKQITIEDSLYYLTSWLFQDARKKRLAELVYESRGGSNVVTLTYSTSSSAVFQALKARVAAYHMQYVGQQRNKGVAWTYFRWEDAYEVSLVVFSTPKAVAPTWYTIVIRPRWR